MWSVFVCQALYRKCTNRSALHNKLANITKDMIYLQATSPSELLIQIKNNFTGMFPIMAFTKIAQTVLLGQTKWPPKCLYQHLLNHQIQNQNNFIKLFLKILLLVELRLDLFLNINPYEPGPEGIKNISCSTQLSTKFQLLIKKFPILILSEIVFIMLINVKMPTLVRILTFMSMINIMLSWVCHFPIGILGKVWYLIVSIPDLCTLSFFEHEKVL